MGQTQREAVQRTLVHELGHHVHHILETTDPELFATTARANHLVGGTQYAKQDRREYFAETFALYIFHRKVLEERDPRGHAMMETTLKRVGLEVNTP